MDEFDIMREQSYCIKGECQYCSRNGKQDCSKSLMRDANAVMKMQADTMKVVRAKKEELEEENEVLRHSAILGKSEKDLVEVVNRLIWASHDGEYEADAYRAILYWMKEFMRLLPSNHKIVIRAGDDTPRIELDNL